MSRAMSSVGLRGYSQGRASLNNIMLGSRSKTVMRGDKYWNANMTAAKKQNLMKKSILWRGNMVQVLLGRKGVDQPTRPPVVRLETQNATLIKINCGGETFITTEDSLSRYPDTLLGDPSRRAEYYDPKTKTHYFDRNQDLFSAILYFYQSPGTFRAPESIDPVIVEEELEFFDIDLYRMIEDYDKVIADNNPQVAPTMRQLINKTITDPSYSKISMLWGFIDLVCIILTIAMLVMETIPNYSEHFANPFEQPYQPYKIAIYSVDVAINLFFTIDLIAKFVSSSNMGRFFFKTMNIMDILAVSPFYVELLVFLITAGMPPAQFLALKVCRIVRVVRVLKLVRHSRQLTEVMEVVSSAKQEFFVLIGVVGVVILLVGTIMYFVEFQIADKANDQLPSILHGCWWAIVTITTVGYGDIYPKSTLGQFTGSFVVLFGIVVLAFPMTIIISKFQDSFTIKKLNANKEMTRKLREMAICTYNRAKSSNSGIGQAASLAPHYSGANSAMNGNAHTSEYYSQQYFHGDNFSRT